MGRGPTEAHNTRNGDSIGFGLFTNNKSTVDAAEAAIAATVSTTKDSSTMNRALRTACEANNVGVGLLKERKYSEALNIFRGAADLLYSLTQDLRRPNDGVVSEVDQGRKKRSRAAKKESSAEHDPLSTQATAKIASGSMEGTSTNTSVVEKQQQEQQQQRPHDCTHDGSSVDDSPTAAVVQDRVESLLNDHNRDQKERQEQQHQRKRRRRNNNNNSSNNDSSSNNNHNNVAVVQFQDEHDDEFMSCDGITLLPQLPLTSTTCACESAAILFNMALSYHLSSTYSVESIPLHNALTLYEMACSVALRVESQHEQLQQLLLLQSYTQQQQHQQQRQCISRVIMASLNNIGQVYHRLGKYKKARDYLDDLSHYVLNAGTTAPTLERTEILERREFLLNAMLLHEPRGAPAA